LRIHRSNGILVTLTAQIGRLAFEGASNAEIARRTGASTGSVSKLVSRLRKRHGDGIARHDIPKLGFLMKLPEHELSLLMEAARTRGVRPTELAEQILATVLTEALVVAVLDDGEGDG
jgi:DNA-binding MarR family transcriptional regulator